MELVLIPRSESIRKFSSPYTNMTSRATAIELLSKYDNKTPMFTMAGIETYARLTDAHDLDTCKVVIPFADGSVHRVILRLMGVDSPEMTSKDPTVKDWAVKARNRMLSLVAPGVFEVDGNYSKKEIIRLLQENVALVYIKVQEFDKFGRCLADLYYSPEDLETIQSICIREGYCKPYFGKTKNQWTADDCKTPESP